MPAPLSLYAALRRAGGAGGAGAGAGPRGAELADGARWAAGTERAGGVRVLRLATLRECDNHNRLWTGGEAAAHLALVLGALEGGAAEWDEDETCRLVREEGRGVSSQYGREWGGRRGTRTPGSLRTGGVAAKRAGSGVPRSRPREYALGLSAGALAARGGRV